jgi:hypothetical protein
MPPRIWPENHRQKNDAEQALFDALYAALGPEDAILSNMRLTDREDGDIEIDLIALIKTLGVVVFETKGGTVTFNGVDFKQSDRNGSRKIKPHDQVLRNLYPFKNFLRERWSYGNIKTEWMLAFPFSHFSQTIDIPAVHRDRIIDYNDINNVLANVGKTMQLHSNKNPPRYADWVDRAFEAAKGHSMLETDPLGHIKNSYLQIKRMTHERRSILEMVQENDRIYVRGPAGSGKSWLAFEQAKIWADQGLRVGITVYNRGLASYMRRKVAEIGLEDRFGFVGHFHRFAEGVAEKGGQTIGFADEWLKDDAKVADALVNYPEAEKYDAWVVDEAQDFDPRWWKVITETLKDPAKGRLAIYGDPAQSVYGDKEWPIEGFAKIRLSENLRNSQQIAKSAQALIEEKVRALGPDSFEVEYVVVENEEDVIDAADDAVARMTDQEFWNPGEIALLTTKYRHPVHEEKRRNQDSYWDEFWSSTDVFYGTVQGFKGLERSVVVLAINGIHESASFEDLMYVGITRGRDRLVVVGRDDNLGRLRNN